MGTVAAVVLLWGVGGLPGVAAGNIVPVRIAQGQTAEERLEEAIRLNDEGIQQLNTGQLREALETFERVLAIVREIEDRQSEGTTLNNLGAVYTYLGQYPQALEYYQQALAIQREIGNRSGEGATLNNLGQVYDTLGQYPQALEYFQAALAIYQEIGDRSGESTTLNNLGSVYDNLGQYPQALEYYQPALVIAREIGDRSGEGATLNNLGQVYNNLGQYPQALEYYQPALVIARKVGNRFGEGTTLNNLGFVYGNLEQHAEAERYFFDAIVVWESLRPSELSDQDKISIFETQSFTYRFLQEVLIAQNKTETALEIAERGRARAFVELMALRLSRQSQEEFVPPPPPTVAQIRQVAQQQNATLVEYSIVENKLYIWIVSPNGEIAFRQIEIAEVLDNASLAELVDASRIAMGVRGRGVGVQPRDEIDIVLDEGNTVTAETRLQQLHQLLIEPIADLLPTNPEDRVIFLPQGELFLVPFPALQDVNGTYLVEKHTLLTAPSIQVLELTHRPNPPAPFPSREGGEESPSPRRGGIGERSVLVVGNPTMPTVQLLSGETLYLSSLPGAEREAAAIADFLGTEALIGDAATESAVLERLPQASIVHLATHGLLDDFGYGIPGAIALAPYGNNDGLLTAGEILDLKLNADLVVLSACDTGRGEITGDGVVGLSRALVTAGVPSIVVSLWKVDDAATSELMQQFYRNWQESGDKAQALRQAMLTTMQQYPEPSHWAAFTLIGEAN